MKGKSILAFDKTLFIHFEIQHTCGQIRHFLKINRCANKAVVSDPDNDKAVDLFYDVASSFKYFESLIKMWFHYSFINDGIFLVQQ